MGPDPHGAGEAPTRGPAIAAHKGHETKEYASSEHGRRYFCATCGTGLYYRNQELLLDITDVQSATLDDPAAIPPQLHIQTADRIDWMKTAHALPEFKRFSSQG